MPFLLALLFCSSAGASEWTERLKMPVASFIRLEQPNALRHLPLDQVTRGFYGELIALLEYPPETVEIRSLMSEAFYKRVVQIYGPDEYRSRWMHTFRSFMAIAGLPVNLTPGEMDLFKSQPNHRLFHPVALIPRSQTLKSERLAELGLFFMIDVVEALYAQRSLEQQPGIGPKTIRDLHGALDDYLGQPLQSVLVDLNACSSVLDDSVDLTSVSTEDLLQELRRRGFHPPWFR